MKTISTVFVQKFLMIALSFAFVFGAPQAFALTTYESLTFHPIGIGTYDAWDVNIGDALYAVGNNDADDTYITTTHIGNAETFTFSTPVLPVGAEIDTISIYMYAKKTDVSDDGITLEENNPRVAFRVENGTHTYDSAEHIIANDGTYALYELHLGVNPLTGTSWTNDDLVSGATRFGIVRTNEGSETGIEPRVTKVWMDVTYASNSTTTTATSTEGGSGGSGGSGSGSGSGSSTSTNTVPTANAQSITTPVDTTATTTLTGTDADIPVQTLTYAIATTTTNGTTTLVGNVITYVPNPGFVGTDSFTFVVSDGIATSTPATVTITVGTPSSSGGSGSGSGSGSGGSSSSSGGSGSSSGGSSTTFGGGYFVNANGQPVSGGNSGAVGQVLGASSTCGIYITKYTRNGYDNDVETVKKIQMFLNSYLKVSIPVTGYYGPLTEKYVKELQLKHKDVMIDPWNMSTPTGIAYLTTVVGINNIVCPDLKLPIPTDLIVWSKHSDTPKKAQ